MDEINKINEINKKDQKMIARTEEEKKLLISRFKKIEGQIRGIQTMVEEDRYCIDILTQISSAKSALENAGMVVLERHAKMCLKKSFQTGNEEESIEELMGVIKRFVK